ncbi:MAG: hypothetical protein Q8J78_01495 [Moraxellaceae bacterium]|nr:hypothetical protein [Moraxellaceae bacterium]
MKKIIFFALSMFALQSQAALFPLDADELSTIVAQDGVAVGLDWRLNATDTGAVLPLCTALATYRECRMAWNFSNRGTQDVNQKWLVLKGISFALKIPYLTVDASSVTYTTDASASKTIPAAVIGFGSAAADPASNTKIQLKNLVIDNIAFEQDTAARRGYEADAVTEPTGAAIPAGRNTGFMALQVNGPANVANIRIDGTVKIFSCLGDHPSC